MCGSFAFGHSCTVSIRVIFVNLVTLAFAFLTTAEILTLVSVLLGGGFITALIAVYRARPERDSVIVSSAQNAAEILQGLNKALYDELNREREKRAETEKELDRAEDALRSAGVEWDREYPKPHTSRQNGT